MRLLVVLAILVSLVMSCEHIHRSESRQPASSFSPIEVVLEMYKEGETTSFLTLHPLGQQTATNYSYDNIFNYLSIRHQNPNKQDQCFSFVHKFKKGEVMLPQRSQILSLASGLLTEDDLKNKKPSLTMHLQVEEPKKRFNEFGRVWALRQFSIKAPTLPPSSPIDCKSFEEEKMYSVLQELISQLSKKSGPPHQQTTQSK